MGKMNKAKFEGALANALKAKRAAFGNDITISDYELVIDREYGWLTAKVVYSNMDMEDVPINYTITYRKK